MPPIIDESTWHQAQKKREDARSILADPKGWLLQGICFCGKCGHVLKCLRKRPGESGYYACRGRVSRNSRDGNKRCDLPYIRADWLEREVWDKVKEVLNNSEKLTECVNKSLVELEERKKELGAESMAVENKLETVRAKAERLGMAFADGAVSENTYKTKLKLLKKEEDALIKSSHNIDPFELGEVVGLGIQIDMVKEVLSKGSLLVTDSGIFGQIDDIYSTLDSNVSAECDKGAITPGFEITDLVKSAMDTSPDFQEGVDLQEKRESMLRNQRAILQKFNIRVIIYPEHVEIQGTIPTQILDKVDKEKTAPIISSPSFTKGGGGIKRGAGAPLRRPACFFSLRGGGAPLSCTPLYSQQYLWFVTNVSGWRGDRGEVIKCLPSENGSHKLT
jgi:RNA polymerase-binding transcription factor DksA